MQVSGLRWRKSSYSASGGGECVEVAAWRKSSYSSSGNSAECVEVAAAGSGGAAPGFVVAVRDSKDPDGPALLLTPGQWRTLTSWVKTGTAS